jgi:hypothetical protein
MARSSQRPMSSSTRSRASPHRSVAAPAQHIFAPACVWVAVVVSVVILSSVVRGSSDRLESRGVVAPSLVAAA